MSSPAEKNSSPTTFRSVLQRIPGAALLFAVVPLVVLGYLGWFYYGAEHLDNALYSLQKKNLAITEQPAWIKSNVLDEVYENHRLDRISLLDPSANATIAQAFETHDWVKSASRVVKVTGGQVSVDLVFRRPAAMVYYEPELNTNEIDSVRKPGFYPIDEDGIILPTRDFDSAAVWDYFLIYPQDSRPALDVGMAFGNASINEAIVLSQFLIDVRESLGLQKIWIDRDVSVGPSPWSMTVVTKDKHQIRWGHAPGFETSGELSASVKREQLISLLTQWRKSTGGPMRANLMTGGDIRPVSIEK